MKFTQVSWVKGIIDRVTSKWQRGPRVAVVASPFDLPIPDATAGQRGLYTPRGAQVHIVASQAPWTILPTLQHEAVGHHGLRLLLRGHWPAFLGGLVKGMRDKRERAMQRIEKRVKINYGRGLTPQQMADEIAAHAAQDATCPHTGQLSFKTKVKTRWAAVKRALVREKPGKLRFGFSHLAATLREAARRFTDRFRRVGVPTGRPRFQPRSPLRLPKWKRMRRT